MAKELEEIYAGRIDLNPSCIGSDSGHVDVELCKRAQGLLKVVFFRLGHNMRIYVTTGEPTSASADSEDEQEEREIKNIVNIVFFTYFQCEYNAIQTMRLLEECKFIPPAKTITA